MSLFPSPQIPLQIEDYLWLGWFVIVGQNTMLLKDIGLTIESSNVPMYSISKFCVLLSYGIR